MQAVLAVQAARRLVPPAHASGPATPGLLVLKHHHGRQVMWTKSYERHPVPVQAVGGPWVADALGGGARQGALTEAQISDELGPNYDIPAPMRRARATISWWQVGAQKLVSDTMCASPAGTEGSKVPATGLVRLPWSLQTRPIPSACCVHAGGWSQV